LKAPVVVARFRMRHIAMRAPAILVFSAGKLRAATNLRTAGKAAREVRLLALGKGGDDVAAAHLVAEEMRRGRHDGGIGRLCRHPVDPGEMEAADAAGLVTPRTAHIVEPALEAADR